MSGNYESGLTSVFGVADLEDDEFGNDVIRILHGALLHEGENVAPLNLETQQPAPKRIRLESNNEDKVKESWRALFVQLNKFAREVWLGGTSREQWIDIRAAFFKYIPASLKQRQILNNFLSIHKNPDWAVREKGYFVLQALRVNSEKAIREANRREEEKADNSDQSSKDARIRLLESRLKLEAVKAIKAQNMLAEKRVEYQKLYQTSANYKKQWEQAKEKIKGLETACVIYQRENVMQIQQHEEEINQLKAEYQKAACVLMAHLEVALASQSSQCPLNS